MTKTHRDGRAERHVIRQKRELRPSTLNYKHGRYTAEAIASRRWLRQCIRDVIGRFRAQKKPRCGRGLEAIGMLPDRDLTAITDCATDPGAGD
jgi:hypothetical protein